MNLAEQSCVPCDTATGRLADDDVAMLRRELPGWEVRDNALVRSSTFRDFVEAMRFVNAMADLAETEGHHPDFTVHYNRVDVKIWTHAVGGLTANDFILATKISALG